MVFDLETAQQVSGFDLNTATSLTTPAEIIYDEPNDRVISAPAGMGEEEFDFSSATQVDKKSKGGFFGLLESTGDTASDLGIGLASFGASVIPTIFGGLDKEFGERLLERRKLLEGKSVFLKPPRQLPDDASRLDKAVRLGIGRFPGADDLVLNLLSRTKLPNRLARAGDAILKHNQKFMIENGLVKGDKGIAFDIGSGFGSAGAAIGVTMLTKNPSYAAALFGTLQKSTLYQEAREAGFTPEQAGKLSTTGGALEAALEFVGDRFFLGAARIDKKLNRILFRGLEEFVQEAAQTATEETLTQLAGIREVDLEQAVRNTLYAGALGLITGGGVATITTVIESVGKQEGLTKVQINAVAESVVKNQEEIINAGAEIIEREASQLTRDDADSQKVVAIIEKFETGQDISEDEIFEVFDNITTDEQKILLRAVEQKVSVVKKKEELIEKKEKVKTIEAEEKAIVKRIDILEGEAKKIKTQLAKSTETETVNTLNRQLAKINKELDALIVDQEKIGARKLISTAAQVAAEQRESLKAVKSAFREGVAAAKTDVKAAQSIVIEALEKSGLELKDRAKFIRSIKNIQTLEQLNKRIPKLEERIVNLIEGEQRRKIKSSIKKVLKKTKARKVSGKPVGKFTAEVQSTLDILRTASRATVSEAEAKIVSNLELGADITVEQAMENRVLSIMADVSNIPVKEMSDVLLGINELILTGKSSKLLKDAQRKERLGEVKEQFVQGITRGRDLENVSRLDIGAKVGKLFNEARAAESGLNNGWFDTLDLILGKTSDKLFNFTFKGKQGEGDKARNFLTNAVFEAIQKEKGLAIDFSRRFLDIASDSFGAKNSRQVQKRLLQDEKVKNRGKFVREGEEVAKNWEISIAEGRKLWMELQDPTLRERLREANGITDEMETVLELDILQPDDLVFAQAQLDLYKELYPEVDKVYATTYGVHLPNNPFYSPIRSEFREQIGNTNEFLDELKSRMSTVPSFGKLRTATQAKIVQQSDVSVMMNHIAQSSHFIAMSETARDLNSIFTDPTIRKSIESTFGKTMLENIDNYIMDFTSGHVARAEKWSESLNVLNKNFTISALGLKPNLYPKQMVSVLAFASDIPTASYVKGMASFADNPKKAIAVLSKSSLMQTRGAAQDVDIIKNVHRKAGKVFGEKQTLENALLFTTKLGDRGAIYMGGWSVYQYHKSLGKSDAQALAEFEKAVASTQQSSDLDQLSRLQANRNPFYKAMTMFMSSPNAYWRAEKRAIRQAIRGQISIQEAGKKVFIFHFLLPMFFQYISDGFDFDEKNQTRAAVLGSLNGFMILGSLLVDAGAAAQGVYYRREDLNFLTGPVSLFEAGARAYRKGEIDFEDLMIAAGQIAAVPVKQGINIVEGIEDINKGDPVKGVKRVLGWTENTIGKSKSKSSLGKIPGF